MLRGLTPIEKLVAVGFPTAVLAVFVAAAAILVRWAACRLLRRPVRRGTRRVRWTRRVVLALAAGGLVCIAYAHFVEPYWVDVTHVRIETGKLPPGAEPVRLVHISDLHCDAEPRAEDRLVAAVAEQKPDAILFTGDAANSRAGIEVFRRTVGGLAEIAPVYGVRGNWDYYFGGANPLAGTALKELDGDAAVVRRGESAVVVIGVPAGEAGLPPVEPIVPDDAPGRPIVLLHHYPDKIEQAADRGADLYLAGHTHGGQVTLPFYGALITLSKYGKRFESGLHRVGRTWLYVNRGFGMEGGRTPRVRFCARPEVTVIDLAPEERAK